MENDTSSLGLPTSGRWSGYYAYHEHDVKHRMTLHLTFSGTGVIEGDGIDDIGMFHISGVFKAATREATWLKVYVGMHSVDYRGMYDGRSIFGTWLLGGMSGPFRIWPGEEGGLGEEEAMAVEEPDMALV